MVSLGGRKGWRACRHRRPRELRSSGGACGGGACSGNGRLPGLAALCLSLGPSAATPADWLPLPPLAFLVPAAPAAAGGLQGEEQDQQPAGQGGAGLAARESCRGMPPAARCPCRALPCRLTGQPGKVAPGSSWRRPGSRSLRSPPCHPNSPAPPALYRFLYRRSRNSWRTRGMTTPPHSPRRSGHGTAAVAAAARSTEPRSRQALPSPRSAASEGPDVWVAAAAAAAAAGGQLECRGCQAVRPAHSRRAAHRRGVVCACVRASACSAVVRCSLPASCDILGATLTAAAPGAEPPGAAWPSPFVLPGRSTAGWKTDFTNAY